MNWKKEIKDQSAHFIAGLVAVISIYLVGFNPLTGAWTTLCVGLSREFTEWQRNPSHGSTPFSGPGAITSLGSLRDLFVWALSGFVLGLIA